MESAEKISANNGRLQNVPTIDDSFCFGHCTNNMSHFTTGKDSTSESFGGYMLNTYGYTACATFAGFIGVESELTGMYDGMKFNPKIHSRKGLIKNEHTPIEDSIFYGKPVTLADINRKKTKKPKRTKKHFTKLELSVNPRIQSYIDRWRAKEA